MSDRSRLRLFVLRVLVLSLLLTLLGRLWFLQVLAGDQYARAAQDNQVRSIITAAARGAILDDQGRPFVRNRTALVVSVDRTKLLRQPDSGKAVLARLAAVLHTTPAELSHRIQLCGAKVKQPCWNGSPYQPVPVSDKASTRQALQILERQEDFPGVSAQVQAVRDYPQPDGASAAHLLGYLGPISDAQLQRLPAGQRDQRRNDLIGQAGLEKTYDTFLRGATGVRQVSVDHVGNVTGQISERPPRPGDQLVTSLDAGVQVLLEKVLGNAIQLAHNTPTPMGGPADSAAGVVLDAQTGHIVAMASNPGYSPAVYAGGGISTKDYRALTSKGSGQPLIDRAVQGEYSPGSTFKLISTAGVVKEGYSLYGYYACPSVVTVGGQQFHNFEGESFPVLDLHGTLVRSCDTVFYQFAKRDWQIDNSRVAHHQKPIEGVQAMARAFGLGSPTGIDLPDESAGLIQGRAEKLAAWKSFVRPNACVGAKKRPKGSEIQALDAYNCRYGYLFLPGDQVNTDIGQGDVLVTPLQLAAAYAALVNGGKVFSPRLAKAIVSPSGQLVQRINAPLRSHVPVSHEVLDYIKSGLRGVIADPHGTAYNAFKKFPFGHLDVGGKTGTAETDVTHNLSTAWFASFAGPPGQPSRYVAIIMVPKGGQGGAVAAPAMRQLWDGIFGLEGHHAVIAHGQIPSTLPHIAEDGTVVPPGRAGSSKAPAHASGPLPFPVPGRHEREQRPPAGTSA